MHALKRFVPVSGYPATIALLVALLVASVVLTVGTIRTDADARRATNRALAHSANLTAWELAQHLTADLNTSATISSWLARRAADLTAPSAALPRADSIFAASAALPCNTCPPRLRGESVGVLQLNVEPRRLILAGTGWRSSDTTTLDTLASRMVGAADSFRTRGVVDSLGPWVVPRAAAQDDGTLLLAQLARNERQTPAALYVLVISQRSIDSLFRRTMRRTQLLPASMTRGTPADSLVRIEILTPSGARVVANDSLDEPSAFVAESPVRGVGTGLIVRSTLTSHGSEIAGELSASGTHRAQAFVVLAVVVVLTFAAAWQVKRRAELERARTDFIASVSHELQTPLALVTAYTETMLLGRTRDADEQRRFLGVVLREARRLARLVDNVLRFSTTDRAAPALTMVALDLLELATQACDEFEPVVRARDMELVVSGQPLEVMGDREALRQVLLNILDNAVKYGPPKQTIDVRVAHGNDSVVLTVDDEGPGVPDAERVRVFDRFVRLTSALDDGARPGSGIGLSIVRDIVARHGGRALLEDTPAGVGLRVKVELRHVIST